MIKKLFKDKKYRYRNLILILIPFVLIIGLFCYVSVDSIRTITNTITNKGGQVSESIEEYDYHLINGATDLQKDLFKELGKAVKSEDDRETAMAVAKNFVADFYTWTNKAGQYDVGGMYYVFSPQKSTIYSQARNQFYKYVSTYIEEYGQDNILEVETVEADCGDGPMKYEFGGVTYDAYAVTCNWTYVNHKNFTEKEYRTKEYFTVIKNADGRFEIVQAYGD